MSDSVELPFSDAGSLEGRIIELRDIRTWFQEHRACVSGYVERGKDRQGKDLAGKKSAGKTPAGKRPAGKDLAPFNYVLMLGEFSR